MWQRQWTILALGCVGMLAGAGWAQEAPFFSGPQIGESVAPLQMQLAFSEDKVDPVAVANGRPLLLIFVHQLTRPSVATVRALAKFAELRKNDLQAAIVFLDDDTTALRARLRRARHALPTYPAIGMSVDGAEGPGAYGLNRNATLTIIFAKSNRVVANFALKDTSVAVDVPKIVAAVCKEIGGDPPALKTLLPRAAMRAGDRAGRLPDLLRRVIRKDVKPEDVDAAAKEVEAYVAKNRAAARRLGEILNRIVAADKLDQYGSEHARTYLKKWYRQYSSGAKQEADSERREPRGGNGSPRR